MESGESQPSPFEGDFQEIKVIASYSWARYPASDVYRYERPTDWTDEQWNDFCEELTEAFQNSDALDVCNTHFQATNFYETVPYVAGPCRVYWGSHGCMLEHGHAEHHKCDCCTCEDHPDPNSGCVGAYPYYGPDTNFYGEDA